MYPETDIPDFVVTKPILESVSKGVPEKWGDKVRRYQEKFGLSRELALKLYDSGYSPLFERLRKELDLAPSVLASSLVDLPARLTREGVQEESITDEFLVSIIKAVSEGKIAKEAAFDVALMVGQKRAKTVDGAISSLGLIAMTRKELEAEVDRVLKENRGLASKGDSSFSTLMGLVMARVRGKADGKDVSEVLREKLSARETKGVRPS
jgi:glutamyl-tRNA(Gln) amidotransferase subunit E